MIKVRLELEAEYTLPALEAGSTEDLLDLEEQYVRNELKLMISPDASLFKFTLKELKP